MNTQFSAAHSPDFSMQGLTPEQVQAFQALIEQTRLQNQSAAVETERKEKRHCNRKSPAKGAFPAEAEEPSAEEVFEKTRKAHLRELKKLGFSPEQLEEADDEFCRNYGAEVVFWSTEDQQELERIWAEEIKWLVVELTPPPEWAPSGVRLRWSELNEDRLRPSKQSPGTKAFPWTQEGSQQPTITIQNEADQENYNISHDVNDEGQRGELTPEAKERLKAVKNGEKLTGWALHDQRVEEQEEEAAQIADAESSDNETVAYKIWKQNVQRREEQEAAIANLVYQEDIARVQRDTEIRRQEKLGRKKPGTKKLRRKKPAQDEKQEEEELLRLLVRDEVAQTLFQ